MAPRGFATRHSLLAEIIEGISLDLGRTISAEHGIGSLKTDRFVGSVSPALV